MPDECLSPSLLAFSGDVSLQIFNAKFQHSSLVWGAHGSNQLLPCGMTERLISSAYGQNRRHWA